jgi:alanine racemase
MNFMMADILDIQGGAIGEEVVLIGHKGNDRIVVEELAIQSEAVNTEFLVRLAPGISRIAD